MTKKPIGLKDFKIEMVAVAEMKGRLKFFLARTIKDYSRLCVK